MTSRRAVNCEKVSEAVEAVVETQGSQVAEALTERWRPRLAEGRRRRLKKARRKLPIWALAPENDRWRRRGAKPGWAKASVAMAPSCTAGPRPGS